MEIALLFVSVRWYGFPKSIINRAEMKGEVGSFSMMVFFVFDKEPTYFYKWFELSTILLFGIKFSDSNDRIRTIYTIIHRQNSDKWKMNTSPVQRISSGSFTMSHCGITTHSKSPSFALSMECSAISNGQILAIHSIAYPENERDERLSLCHLNDSPLTHLRGLNVKWCDISNDYFLAHWTWSRTGGLVVRLVGLVGSFVLTTVRLNGMIGFRVS